MNGIKYLTDTNCFIYLLDKNPIILPFVNDLWAFSYITEIELLSKKLMTDHEEFLVRDVLQSCYKVNHSQILSELVVNLRRKYSIKIPGAFIVASAQLIEVPVITADKQISKIGEIDCILLLSEN